MCKKCTAIVDQAVDNGIPAQVAIDWLWENTPFPAGEPTEEQYAQLMNLRPIKR